MELPQSLSVCVASLSLANLSLSLPLCCPALAAFDIVPSYSYSKTSSVWSGRPLDFFRSAGTPYSTSWWPRLPVPIEICIPCI